MQEESDRTSSIHSTLGCDSLDASDWNAVYLGGDPSWNLDGPAPPFEYLLSHPPDWLRPGSLIYFGCGLGHDAALFAQFGFDVVAVDFATKAVELAKRYERTHTNLDVINHDIFSLDNTYNDQFDFVLEHTCYCAISPSKRVEYAQIVHDVLKPEGIYLGLFYRFDDDEDIESGPPFSVSMDGLKCTFGALFTIFYDELPTNSIEKRRGRERLIAMRAI